MVGAYLWLPRNDNRVSTACFYGAYAGAYGERDLSFRESPVWRQALELAPETCRLATRLPVEEAREVWQCLLDASIRVPSHIAGVWSEELESEKLVCLNAAQGALARSATLVILCETLGWVTVHETGRLHNLMTDLSRRLTLTAYDFRRQA